MRQTAALWVLPTLARAVPSGHAPHRRARRAPRAAARALVWAPWQVAVRAARALVSTTRIVARSVLPTLVRAERLGHVPIHRALQLRIVALRARAWAQRRGPVWAGQARALRRPTAVRWVLLTAVAVGSWVLAPTRRVPRTPIAGVHERAWVRSSVPVQARVQPVTAIQTARRWARATRATAEPWEHAPTRVAPAIVIAARDGHARVKRRVPARVLLGAVGKRAIAAAA